MAKEKESIGLMKDKFWVFSYNLKHDFRLYSIMLRVKHKSLSVFEDSSGNKPVSIGKLLVEEIRAV